MSNCYRGKMETLRVNQGNPALNSVGKKKYET